MTIQTTQLKTIDIKKLSPHPQHINRMSEELLSKLKENIAHTGIHQPLLVRERSGKKGAYDILDGHSRWQALKALNEKSVQCIIVKADEPIAELLIGSLNALRGSENPYERALLVNRLTEHLPKKTLVTLLPESEAQLEDLLQLLKHNEDEQKKTIQKMIKKASEQLPVHVSFLLKQSDADELKMALDHFRTEDDKDDSEAFVAMIHVVVKEHGIQRITEDNTGKEVQGK